MLKTTQPQWLALIRAPGIGSGSIHKLLQHFGSIADIFSASAGQLHTAGLKPGISEAILHPDEGLIASDSAWLAESGHYLVTWGDPHYPALLSKIPGPPAALFLKGNPELLKLPHLAIVGSRNPTSGGAQNATQFAKHLASCGLGICSGMATGIDTASHVGALQAGGFTIAVVATGLDRVYPASNRELAHTIAAEGLLVSEFPPGTGPNARHFPSRNRIISGLSVGTLVVEAALKSGSLITARLAAEQGREVFAIPGSIHNPLARGCHGLIRQGVKLVETAEHILEELSPLLADYQESTGIDAAEDDNQRMDQPPLLDDIYLSMLDCIGYDPLTIDELIHKSRLTPEAVSSMLLVLELQGYVESLPGNRTCRTSLNP
ncbi:MAG TPA: DNA-protecting protein DprA [Gammaproteobacteria bacterium]|nr:DNA-protecting protein DprA [Gammaproteobacteria bacterium]